MTNAELLLDVIGEIDDEYIVDIDRRVSAVRTRRKAMCSSMAAVFAVAFSVLIFAVTSGYMPKADNSASNEAVEDSNKTCADESDGTYEEYQFDSSSSLFGSMGSGGCCNYGMTGIATDGYFYFQVPGDGIYRYTVNGSSEKIVDTKSHDEWLHYVVNDNGLYFTNSYDVIFRVPHNSTVSTPFLELPNALFSIYEYSESDILINSTYTLEKDEYGNSDYILNDFVADGITGEEKTLIYKYESIFDKELYDELSDTEHPNEYTLDEIHTMTHKENQYTASEINYQLGNRALTIKEKENGGYELTENGKKLTKNVDALDTTPSKATQDYVIFSIGEEGAMTDPVWHYYIARSNGNDSRVIATHAPTPEGNDKFFFFIDYEDNIVCYDIETGKESILLSKKDLSYKDLYSDGNYIYLCEYNGERSAKKLKVPPMCYKIIYNDNGKPCNLELVDVNIVE